MRKIHVLALALVAVFAFGAIGATAAFAETTETEYLISGQPVVAGELVDDEGELLLTDHKGGIFGEEVMVLCSGLSLGEVLSAVDIDVTTIYALGTSDPETLGSAAIPCTAQTGICSEPVAKAINLDWLAELMLVGTVPEVLLTPETGMNGPGWSIECSKIAEDSCTSPEALVEVKNETNGTVDAFFNEETGTCTRGGAGSALVEGLIIFLSVTAGLPLEIMGS
jgi:hypothetical protein